eukprot:568848-Ditylum_brightwellii.AAC.1
MVYSQRGNTGVGVCMRVWYEEWVIMGVRSGGKMHRCRSDMYIFIVAVLCSVGNLTRGAVREERRVFSDDPRAFVVVVVLAYVHMYALKVSP